MKMKRFIRTRPRPGTIIAIVALVVALSGTAVAAGGFLPKTKFTKFKSNAVQRLTYVNSTQSVPVAAGNEYTTVSANCPAGLHPVGGGVALSPSNQSIWWGDGYLTASGYTAHVANNSAAAATAVTTVSCVAGRATGSPAA
jgi:hypothetical protein